MALPAGFELESPETQNLPSGFQMETAPTPSLGGIALRSAITGLSSPVNMAADFLSGAYNLGSGLLGSESRLPYVSKVQKDALTQIGLPAPETTGQKLFSAGAEAIASPLNYLFPGSSAIKSLLPAAQIPVRAAEQAIVGTGAEAGGMVGEYGGEKLGFPTTGRIVGGLFGGAGSAYGTGTALRVAPLAGKGFDLAKSQWDKVLQGSTKKFLEQIHEDTVAGRAKDMSLYGAVVSNNSVDQVIPISNNKAKEERLLKIREIQEKKRSESQKLL